jgi:outer membrane protein assembly factor BamD
VPAALVVALAAWGCSSTPKQDPVLALSSAEALAEGKALMEQGKYARARDYLTHAFEVEPNSVGGREALLLAADAYYLQGGVDSYVRAEAKYRDFQTRFPTAENAAYVQFQIASSLSHRIERPDRDQTSTRKALEEYRSVIELYPTSQYAVDAEQEIERLRQTLAAHELMVGYFYLRYGNFNGATSRLEGLLEDYPDFAETDRALYYLGMTYRKSDREEESREAFRRLTEEYPESPWADKIPQPRSS